MINKLILGDNLEILKQIEPDTIDLIYLDPPFFSNRNYEVIWGDEGEVRSFADRWSGGIDHYIGWLKERVEQMHRILKPTGSIFLHCDWHANAYIRVEILDKIFGTNHFRSEIIWKRTNAHNTTSKNLGILIDTIFFYSKSNVSTFNAPKSEEHGEEYITKTYRHTDEKGVYRTHLVERNAALGIRPNLIYEYKGYTPKWGWMMEKVKLEKLDKDGKLVWNSNGTPQRKIYLDEVEKPVLGNLWYDIENIQSSKESIGYPTQKPEKLMQRIIEMASNEGDIVLDPFVGGGTTIAVADKLQRKWLGIDQSVTAVKVTEFRLNNQQDLFSKPFIVQLHKYDYDTLRYKDAFEFESFIVQQYGGTPNTKQRSDLGLDGKTNDNTPIQVKRSDGIGRNVVDNFLSAVQRSDKKLFEKNKAAKKPVGFIIAFSFGKGAIEEVARLKNHDDIIIKLITVEEIIPIAKKPTITVEVKEAGRDKKQIREIEFIAKGESKAGIEFYAWDFDYKKDMGFKPMVLIDKQGKQLHKFKPGQHNIAVKVVDNEGLDNIEIIKLKVNGTVEREK
ncbi:MAG TPA: site-specific DNA-methyltransferase [Bacteroidia bacterium]